MSRHDYEDSFRLAREDHSFVALIMAAYRKADTHNAARLDALFPEITAEIRARYGAPGGALPGDP